MRENRILAFLVVVAVAALVISTTVQAQQANRQPAQKQAPLSGYWGRFFVDADGDGVCDNLGMRVGRGGGWRGLARSQIQQSSGGSQTSAQTGTTSQFIAGRGFGRFFVDRDGDGVCDNLGMRVGRIGVRRVLVRSQIQQSSGGSQTSAQTGTTSWFSTGRGFGRFFIDRDGDGVCDNLGMRIGRNSQAVIGGGRGLRGGRNRGGL